MSGRCDNNVEVTERLRGTEKGMHRFLNSSRRHVAVLLTASRSNEHIILLLISAPKKPLNRSSETCTNSIDAKSWHRNWHRTA